MNKKILYILFFLVSLIPLWNISNNLYKIFFEKKISIFKDYSPVFISLSYDVNVIKELKETYQDVFSLEDEYVFINDFAQLKKIKVINIDNYLDENDLRYDKYIQKIKELYLTKDKKYRIIFIPKIRSFLSFFQDLYPLINKYGNDWFVQEIFDLSIYLSVICFLSILIVTFFFLKENKLLVFFISLPLIDLLLSEGIYILLLVCICYFLSLIFIDKTLKNESVKLSLKWINLLNLYILILAMIISLGIKYNLFPLILDSAILAIELFIIYLQNINKKSSDLFNNYSFITPVFLIFSSSFVLFYTIIPSKNKNHEVLIPLEYEDVKYYNFNNLNLLYTRSFFSVADYISHRAFQESILYNKSYGFPNENEAIILDRFNFNNNDIKQWQEVRLLFDINWLKKELGNVENIYIKKNLTYNYPIALEYRKIIYKNNKMKIIKKDQNIISLENNFTELYFIYMGFLSFLIFPIILLNIKKNTNKQSFDYCPNSDIFSSQLLNKENNQAKNFFKKGKK